MAKKKKQPGWWEKDPKDFTKKDKEQWIENHVSSYTNKVWTIPELKAKLKRLTENDELNERVYRNNKAHNQLEGVAITRALKLRQRKKK